MGGANASSCCIAPETSVVATMAHMRNWNPASSAAHISTIRRCWVPSRRITLSMRHIRTAVVTEKDVLELGLGKNQVFHPRGGESAQQGVEIATHPKHRRAAIDLGARDFRKLGQRSEEHTSELQSRLHLVCRLLLE